MLFTFPLRVKWYQSFGNFLMMAGDGDELQILSARIDIVEGRINALESTLSGVVQELKRSFLKIDDRSLTDSTY